MNSGGGSGRSWRGRGSGPGRFQWRGRGWGRGRGQANGRNGTEENGGSDDSQQGSSSWGKGRGGGWRPNYRGNNDSRPPPRKKKNDTLQTIKACVEVKWRAVLPGYDLYYNKGPPQLPETDKKIEAVMEYLQGASFLDSVGGGGSEKTRVEDVADQHAYFSICVEDVLADKKFCHLWPEFKEDLVEEPEQTITLWSAVIYKVIYNDILEQLEVSSKESLGASKMFSLPRISKIRMGFYMEEPVTPLISLKSEDLGRFVTIKGVVVSSGNIRPFTSTLEFRCKHCDAIFDVDQTNGCYTVPPHCKEEVCKNTYAFEPLDVSSYSTQMDYRRITLQDVIYCDIERGTVPKTIMAQIFGTWADHCDTGDVISLSGIVKMTSDYTLQHDYYIEVSAIQQQKNSERTMGGNLFSFSDKDYFFVKDIHEEPNLFRLLIASLCPAIYGNELVKAGLLLCLFGGTAVQGEEMFNRRSDINMLMVGDPGMGKSQMLKVISEVAPKAVYMCGTGSTVAGLTVTLVKDGEEYSLEAGALVMADKGVCCIDEFDKMSNQHHALLEAMEQQSVSVAKSGVYRTLPARATVIAAANPVGGHYNTCKTVTENIKIHPAVLSRFDLIFILLDKPNEEFDKELVAHKRDFGKGQQKIVVGQSANVVQLVKTDPDEPLKLLDRIKVHRGEVIDIVPLPLLRKYIAYARQYVHPKLNNEACEMLKRYYTHLRVSRRGVDSTPVTSRQLESLVRLAEARAKAELREEVTAQDVGDVLEIYDFSLASPFEDEVLAISALSESVLLNSSMIGSGKKAKSTNAQAKQLLVSLQKFADKQSKNLFSVDELIGFSAALGYRDKANALIDTLNNMGFLIKKPGRTYQLVCKDL